MTELDLKLDFMEKGITDHHKQYIKKIHDVIKIHDINEYILDTMETIIEPIMENEEEFRNLFYILLLSFTISFVRNIFWQVYYQYIYIQKYKIKFEK